LTDLAPRLARLGRALRAGGVGVTLRDELDAADALALVDMRDREEVRTALRIALKIPREAYDVFDRAFAAIWSGTSAMSAPSVPRAPRESAPRGGRLLRWDPDARRMGEAPSAVATEGEEPGFSSEALLRRKPFDDGSWSPRELAEMERLLARLARRLASARSRRLVPTRGRGRPDLRSSLPRALRTEGELLSLARRARALDAPRLVFLLDTSGSMEAQGRFLLSFVLALRRGVPRAEAFAFNTELVPLTRSLAPGKVRLTLQRIAASVPDWSGGTRIGESLNDFVRLHLRRSVNNRTVVVILSDGLDRGDPARLAEALRAVRERARRVIWLNPLLGDARYEPLAAGMRAALPHVDTFASAHDLASLERLLPRLAV